MCDKIVNIVTSEIYNDKMNVRQITSLLTLFCASKYFSFMVPNILGACYSVCVPHRTPLLIGRLIFPGLSKEDFKGGLHEH